jgi:hypothetical protein
MTCANQDELFDLELRVARRADELSRSFTWDRRDSSAPWYQAEIELLSPTAKSAAAIPAATTSAR